MTASNALNISQIGYVVFDGINKFTGNTLVAGSGISITNPNGVSGNSVISNTGALTDLHVARYIVSAGGAADGANYTSITTAYAAAVGAGGNQTVFVQPGTYTENITLSPGINITAFPCDAALNLASNTASNVIINGTLSYSSAGTVSISNVQLRTNSATFLSVTGSAASVVNIIGCYLNCLNNNGISYTTANAGSSVSISYCQGNIGTTGISLFTASSTGILNIQYSDVENSGGSSTPSTANTTTVNLERCLLKLQITLTASSSSFTYTEINGGNNTCLTTVTSGSTQLNKCLLNGGSASAASIGTGTTVAMYDCTINSSNTNALTGLGTLNQSLLIFSNTSATSNVSTLGNFSTGITGTFLPALSFGGSSTGITYTTQIGTYVVIGKMVYVLIDVTINSKGVQTGVAAISLPFTSANNSAITTFNGYGIFSTFPASTTVPIGLLSGNTATLGIYGWGAANTITQLTNSNIANGNVFRFSGWYSTA